MQKFHPECVDSTEQEIRAKGIKDFMCHWCDSYTLFINKHTKEKTLKMPSLIHMDVDAMKEMTF